MKLNKKVLCSCMVMSLSALCSFSAFAGTWNTDQRGWTYQNDDGSFVVSNWVKSNGVWYYMNTAGLMATNQFVFHDGSWYFVDENGAMVYDCAKAINGKWYRFDNTGRMITGWQYINENWYYYDGSGAMLTGWNLINDNWYLLGGSDGRMLVGWQQIGNNWYYLFSDGHMAIGAQTVDGKEQLFRTDGVWIQDSDTNGVLNESNVTVDSLFNAAYEDMDWDEIESLAKKYYTSFYQTCSDSIGVLNQWRATEHKSSLTFSSNLTKSSMALAISNKAYDYYGSDNTKTNGTVEYQQCADFFSVNTDSMGLVMAKGKTLSEAIQTLYNKEQLKVICNANYTTCGFGFVRLDDGTYICVVELK